MKIQHQLTLERAHTAPIHIHNNKNEFVSFHSVTRLIFSKETNIQLQEQTSWNVFTHFFFWNRCPLCALIERSIRKNQSAKGVCRVSYLYLGWGCKKDAWRGRGNIFIKDYQKLNKIKLEKWHILLKVIELKVFVCQHLD